MNDQPRVPREKKPVSGNRGAFPAAQRVKKSLSRESEPMDLDVSSYLNVFLALLPMLITMAVFTQIAAVEFSLPPARTPGAQGSESKELDISVVITRNGFQIVGTGRKLDMVSQVEGQYQYDQLLLLLKAIKFQYPSQNSVVLVIDGDVMYDDVIRFMDVCREAQFPDIGLSGEIG